ncbi:MAG: GNAT family N-acetyltransferase [Reinekea sp.]
METTYYLEMNDPQAHIIRPLPSNLLLSEIRKDQPGFNKALYQMVGEPWQWTDKLSLSKQEWVDYVQRDELRTWVAYCDGAIAGYFELEKQGSDVEIKYFGLTREFIGQGLGSPLLSAAVQNAWQWPGTDRVWVHTCTLDHPNALNTYQRSGFKIYNLNP